MEVGSSLLESAALFAPVAHLFLPSFVSGCAVLLAARQASGTLRHKYVEPRHLAKQYTCIAWHRPNPKVRTVCAASGRWCWCRLTAARKVQAVEAAAEQDARRNIHSTVSLSFADFYCFRSSKRPT